VNEFLDLGERVRLNVEGWVRVEGMGPGVVGVVLDCAEGDGGVEFGELAKEERVVHCDECGEGWICV
jgi:hypothetical protein